MAVNGFSLGFEQLVGQTTSEVCCDVHYSLFSDILQTLKLQRKRKMFQQITLQQLV